MNHNGSSEGSKYGMLVKALTETSMPTVAKKFINYFEETRWTLSSFTVSSTLILCPSRVKIRCSQYHETHSSYMRTQSQLCHPKNSPCWWPSCQHPTALLHTFPLIFLWILDLPQTKVPQWSNRKLLDFCTRLLPG